MRNTFASFDLADTKNNNYVKNPYKGVITFIIRKHKAASGEKIIKPSRSVSLALRKYLKYRRLVADDKIKRVFLNQKGTALTKGALSKLLHRTTKEVCGKSLGSRMIRVMAVTEHAKEIQTAEELAHNMLHTSKTQKTYIRKE